MTPLTREQLIKQLNYADDTIIDNKFSRHAQLLLDHDAAQRETIALLEAKVKEFEQKLERDQGVPISPVLLAMHNKVFELQHETSLWFAGKDGGGAVKLPKGTKLVLKDDFAQLEAKVKELTEELGKGDQYGWEEQLRRACQEVGLRVAESGPIAPSKVKDLVRKVRELELPTIGGTEFVLRQQLATLEAELASCRATLDGEPCNDDFKREAAEMSRYADQCLRDKEGLQQQLATVTGERDEQGKLKAEATEEASKTFWYARKIQQENDSLRQRIARLEEALRECIAVVDQTEREGHALNRLSDLRYCLQHALNGEAS